MSKGPRRQPKPERVRPTPRQPERQIQVDTLALEHLAEIYAEEVDETMKKGLDNVLAFTKEIPDGGPFTDYIATMRADAIEAIKEFVTIDPRDTLKVIRLQSRIGDYLRPMEYLVSMFAPFAAAQRGEPAGQDDDEDITSEFAHEADSDPD